MILLKVGKFGHARISWHGAFTSVFTGDVYPAQLIVWPFRLEFGGTGAYAGVFLSVREKVWDPPVWRRLWPRRNRMRYT